MPCLAAILIVLFPRVAIVVMWFFTSFFTGIFQTILWPLLGFIFTPLTLLAYTYLAKINQPQDAFFIVVMIIALVVDLGLAGGARSARRD